MHSIKNLESWKSAKHICYIMFLFFSSSENKDEFGVIWDWDADHESQHKTYCLLIAASTILSKWSLTLDICFAILHNQFLNYLEASMP